GCVTERKYTFPLKRKVPSTSVPDPLQICKSRGSPYRSNISTQIKDQGTRLRDAECYGCPLSPGQPDLARISTIFFSQLLLRTRKPSSGFSQNAFHMGFGLPDTPLKGASWWRSGSRRREVSGTAGASMPRYAQLVMGPAGSGKSTYCATIVQHCEALNRSVQVVNLDPAAEHFNYSVMADIRELIEVDDVMEDSTLQFGPNGGLVFCMEYFANNFDWLEDCLGHVEDDYILFDCPGQIELYTHLPVMKQLVQQLEQWEFRVCGVFLVDSQFMVESFKFISGILSALSAMISLEIPQVNVMTKMDLLSKKAKKEIEKFLDPDMYSLLDDPTSDLRSKKFKKLTNAICGLIDDYSMVRFLPYDQSDEESMNIVLQHIDFAIQYGEDLEFKEPKEHEDESSSVFDEYFQEHQNE
ncbi:hypothetical protein EI555_000714, partial [Monodon monoceros]